MKLSLLTYLLGKDMTLDELIDVVHTARIDGLEVRAEAGHKHGIELDLSADQRAAVKAKLEDVRVPLACLATGCKFEDLDRVKRQAEIDRAKQYCDLAADVGADVDEVINNVGEALHEIGEHADGRNVGVGLEMHGDFFYWEYALEAVRIADHSRVGIVHNCDPREMQFGPIACFYDPVACYVRHVHMHDLESDYPYGAFIGMLKRDGYGGFMSLESSASDDPRRVIGIYAALWREMVANA